MPLDEVFSGAPRTQLVQASPNYVGADERLRNIKSGAKK